MLEPQAVRQQQQAVRQQPPVGRQQVVRQPLVKQLLTAVSVSLLMLEPQAALSVFRLLRFPWLLVKRSTVQLISLWRIIPVALALFKTQ